MLESLAARVHFHGNQLDIQGQDGRILDSQITHVEAHIGTLRPASPIEIKGNLTGTLSDILRTLQEDGLRGRFGRFAKGLRGNGETQLDLDFAIPFNQRGDYRLNGILTFADARLTLPDWSFALSKIDGALNFSLDGLSAKGIRARALGSPLSIDVLPISDGATRIRTTAALSTEAIARQLPTLPLQVASGKADFTIGIDIPSRRAPAGSPTMLSVDSPLQGIEIGLPSPLGKPADGRRALALRLPLNDNAVPASLGLGADLLAQFSADGQRVDVAFGGEQARLGPDTGVRISGHLGEVDTAAWHTALSDLAQSGGAQLPPIDVDLQMARIGLPALAIDDARLTLQHRGGEWRGSLESASLAGRFVVPATLPQQPIAVTLDRLALTLPVANDAATPSPAPDPTTAMEPTGLPGLQLTIADMRVNNAALGQLQLDARRSDTGLHLDTLKLEGGALRVDAQGSWTRGANGVTTRIDGSLAAPRLGDLLVDLGYARQLEEAPSDIAIALTWPGDPAQWHPGTIDGSVSLDIGAGRLAEVDPGVTRVVGLLNLNALTRRLRLDFSDFYKKGYSFDRIAGGFRLTDGKAVIDSLVVDGPTGRLDISGSADLLSESLNQQVRVTPNLDATLPIAGAIAGGPIAGIAVLVAQQVMSDTVDEINRFEYAVNGPWAAPKIVQLDTGGTLSRLLKPLRSGITAAEPPTETEPPAAPAGPRAAVQAYDEPQTPEAPAADARNPLRALLDTLNKGETDSENLPIDQD
jgi:uncharacterized protein (TIGR02099 family)